MHRATLYIFSGLPGAGKTTLARQLAQQLNATYLRIDTIEQGIRDLCRSDVESEGYCLAYRIAKDNLSIGVSVIADSCNTVSVTRDAWEAIARESEAAYLNIVILCSDRSEHKTRIESRISNVGPLWADVENREYHAWDRPHIVIDTSGKSESESLLELLHAISPKKAEQGAAANP